jgi:hypothetical protein
MATGVLVQMAKGVLVQMAKGVLVQMAKGVLVLMPPPLPRHPGALCLRRAAARN